MTRTTPVRAHMVVVFSALVAGVVAVALGSPGSLVGAQNTTTTTTTTAADASDESDTSEVLEVTSVTPWVGSDGEFQVRFGPSTRIPAGSQLTYTIHQSLTATSSLSLRDQVNAAIDGGSTGKVLQAPVPRPFTDYGDPAAGAVLTIPVRSGSGDTDRAFLPNPGIHPVELVLTPPEGPELWRQVVFLNRLPRDYSPSEATTTPSNASSSTPPPVAVTLMVPIETSPTLRPDGTASFSTEQRATMDGASSMLRSVPDAPLTLAVRPNTLDGLARSGQGWSDLLIDAIRTATAATVSGQSTRSGAGSALLELPYVRLDTGALVAAGARTEVDRQVALGSQVLTEVTGTSGVGSTWALDDLLTTASLPVLAAHGVESVVVASSMLRLPNSVGEQQAMTGAVELEGGDGIRAIAYDVGLSQRLSDTSVDAGVRAHEVVALMMATWFGSSSANLDRSAASVILVPPTIDPDVIAALEPSLDGSGPLRASADGSVLPPATSDEPTAELVRRDVPDDRSTVEATTETRRQIASYRSMLDAANPTVALWERLDAETLSTALDPTERNALHASVRGQIAADLAKIEPPRERRVLVTSRETTIPLRFRNDLPYPVRLMLRGRSPRLDISGGDAREVLLEPGETIVDLPVDVQAPGEALMRIEISTPDDGITIASLDIPVRSTAISGVGAALSVISVVFLVLWWIHTHRRRRREEARANGNHPARPTDSTNDAARTDSVTEGG